MDDVATTILELLDDTAGSTDVCDRIRHARNSCLTVIRQFPSQRATILAEATTWWQRRHPQRAGNVGWVDHHAWQVVLYSVGEELGGGS